MASLKDQLKADSSDFIKQATSRDFIETVSLDKINIQQNPRKQFDKTALKELADSIQKNGLLQPIVIDQNFNLIAGERRLRAYKILNLSEIRAVIYKDKTQEAEVLAILENVQREDLTALELAEACLNLSEKYKFTQAQIGLKIGKSRSYVADLIAAARNTKENVGAPTSARQARDKHRIKHFDINFRFSISGKNIDKVSKADKDRLQKKVEQVEKIKEQIEEIMTKYKN